MDDERPSGRVQTERIQIVASTAFVGRIDEWRRRQPKIPSRSEAIRRLSEMALEAEIGDK